MLALASRTSQCRLLLATMPYALFSSNFDAVSVITMAVARRSFLSFFYCFQASLLSPSLVPRQTRAYFACHLQQPPLGKLLLTARKWRGLHGSPYTAFPQNDGSVFNDRRDAEIMKEPFSFFLRQTFGDFSHASASRADSAWLRLALSERPQGRLKSGMFAPKRLRHASPGRNSTQRAIIYYEGCSLTFVSVVGSPQAWASKVGNEDNAFAQRYRYKASSLILFVLVADDDGFSPSSPTTLFKPCCFSLFLIQNVA